MFRRARLLSQLQQPLLLFSGGEIARNAPFTTYPFRADSNFLYLFGPCEPGCAAFFDSDNGKVSFFAPQRTLQAALWSGPRPSFEDLKQGLCVDEVLEVERLEEHIGHLRRGRPLHFLAVADERTTQRAQKLIGQEMSFFKAGQLGPPELLRALGSMRLCKEEDEVEEIGRAAHITHEAQLAAMLYTRPGIFEYEVYAHLLAAFTRHACQEAYSTILSVRGEVLHNTLRSNRLKEGDLLLVDAGAERPSGYAADITRTWPVSGKFSATAKAIYKVVLAANQRCLEAVRPGVGFAALQHLASQILAEGLLELGLLKGRIEDILTVGALGVFFPHGIGHPLGLDVHDLGNFGDILSEPSSPSAETSSGQPLLRMNVEFKEGMVCTVEPGVYFIPQRIRSVEFQNTFGEFIDFEEAERYLEMNGGRGFGGIRIEDNVLCTQTQPIVLSSMIPKQIAEIEALVGTAYR
ncbi:MAG: Xaa-Pro aminopeptidase [Cystobacterineae bacterium]|nr:Xaa-Pro aminopeptidase [Cystobacterineae bacterium]